MAYEPELERLERRYQDDPARNFAQLAETYRKAGRLDDALTLLRGHLAERPNYVSGLVVLGRCLLDQQNDGEARETFERVLGVDGEHIIALRALGEIAERGGDVSQARTWFGRLLEVDPMNDEAEAAMQRLAQAAEAPAAPPEPAVPAEPSLAEELQAEIEAEAGSGYPEAEETDLVQLPDPAAFESAQEPAEQDLMEQAPESEYQLEEVSDEFMPRATYAQPVDVEQIGHIEISSSLPEEEPLISASAEVPEEYNFPTGEQEADFGFGEAEEAAGQAGMDGTDGMGSMAGLEPTAADVSGDEAPAEDLGAVPFDDELGWGAGERVSRQLSREDIEEATHAHEESVEAAAVSELPGLETTELPTGEEAPPPVEGLEAGETLAEVVPLAGLEPTEAGTETTEAAEEEAPVEFVSMPAPEGADQALEIVSEEIEPVVPEVPAESEEAAFDATGEVVDRATAERRASLMGLPLIEEPAPEAPLVLDAQPEPVVTETMAELYARQGLFAEARDVYEQLLRQRPGEPRLQARLAELSRPGARATAWAAADTGAQSVRAMLLEVLASRPGAPAPAAAPPVVPVAPVAPVEPPPMEAAFGGESAEREDEALGAPTRPASDEVSLAAIFGEPSAPPRTSAAAEIAREPAPKATRAVGGFSFDEFFGKPGAAEAKADTPSRRDTLADDEGEEAFKDWLRGLKS
jgi:tetratricopeptide (TPR) repeat protein